MKLNNIINKIKQINPNIKFVGTFDAINKKTGYWETYHLNGNIRSKGNYLNGIKDGYWEYYYTFGGPLWKGHYIDGRLYELE
jgi:antitoxin component YwqK of YwqJK toxin-antitoxin module